MKIQKCIIGLSAILLAKCDVSVPPAVKRSPDLSVASTAYVKDEEDDDIKRIIDNMTIEEKAAQMIITGYTTVEEVKDINFCGVILFRKNIKTLYQTKSDIESIKANASFKIPPFISVDQEGGRVSRLPAEAGQFESAASIGERNDGEYAFSYGKRMGKALFDLGFNLDYAPVCDIYSNPENTVIADRAYGKTPDRVSAISAEIMKGLRSSGIIPAAKHFPGHGDTAVDSHKGLPVVRKSIKELYGFELIPFMSAIENSIEMIMAGHIVIEKADSLPASLSHELITNILRKQMGYEGVVITDDIGMGAVRSDYTLRTAAVMAINAGCDIVLCAQSFESGKEAYAGILEAYERGEISEDRLDESLYRILKLKMRYHIIH